MSSIVRAATRRELAVRLSLAAVAALALATGASAQQLAGPGHAATVLPDGSGPLVLLLGGSDASGNPTTAAVLYAADGAPLAVGDLATAGREHAATRLADGRVLVTGGAGASGTLASIELVELSAGATPALARPAR